MLWITCLVAIVAPAAEPSTRTMWVYKTEAIMNSPAERDGLFAFCAARHITDLFWQMHFTREGDRFIIKDEPALKSFITAATAHHLRIHALSGDPVHALRTNHDRVLARIDALLAFNHSAPSDAQLAGVHFDIEPHALPEWKKASDTDKAAMLTQLVELNARLMDKLHEAKSSLVCGADIVFWLGKTNRDGSLAYPVTFRGVTKDAASHLLDLIDNVGIMSYRDHAEGPNGIIPLVEKIIAIADNSKGRAFVGAKMANIGPSMEGFYSRTEPEMMSELKKVDDAFANHRGYAGLAFFTYEAFKVMPQSR
jgi:hypothetical protein